MGATFVFDVVEVDVQGAMYQLAKCSAWYAMVLGALFDEQRALGSLVPGIQQRAK